jgi:membrane protein YdbS with pleckstrin-like domain
MDRMLGIGTVTFETAGDSSRLVMENVDRPQDVAHRILSLAQSTRSI